MSVSKTTTFLFRTVLFSLCVCASQAQAAPYYSYSWTTTKQGYGSHVGQPSSASFDVAASVIQTGKIGYSDIYNVQMAYPGLSFDNTTVTSNGLDAAVYVDPATGALKVLDSNQGLGVISYAGASINDATTFLSITVGTPKGNAIADQFNALNNGAAYAGYPTAGYWTAKLVSDTGSGNAVPEPASLALVGFGFAGLFGLKSWRRKA